MADGLILNFGAQRNEDYLRLWRFCARGEKQGLPISGWTFELRINSTAGQNNGVLLKVNQSPTTFGSIIKIEDATDGQISVLLKQEDVDALPGRKADVVPFAFNLIITDSTGIRRADVRGKFIVEPGV